ncbi:MAG: DUF4834 family protein [Tannerella sp.]|jgi:hypothetical protein|nr:DUF4834 family protein [Tannerella sp.]
MIKFLAFIFFFFIILLSLLGFSVIRTFKSFFFGDSKSRTQRHTSASDSRQRARANSRQRPAHKKIIPKEEGEYTDYEEVREN